MFMLGGLGSAFIAAVSHLVAFSVYWVA
ncbi:hypothetical protein BAE44_0013017 [Dichanthelium oligosanthes]|uniref:Uncharacterized protein n=1 Tax=Dichanthelium oligosanthes TaxID=888268 RepID=A0A1E5VLN5_9POAL|nr:hypothetical protein BAE44_0013017 [Dichanthelium oligosanthes]